MLFGFAQRAAASAERIFEVLDRPGHRRPAGGGRPARDGAAGGNGNGRSAGQAERGARIRFEHVSFGYEEGGRPTLAGIDLDIAPGSRVAVVGGTGSGKSTLLGLIPRLYAPSEGRVLVDGHDVADLTLDSLRSAVGIVHQEPVLFSASLRDNVAFGGRRRPTRRCWTPWARRPRSRSCRRCPRGWTRSWASRATPCPAASASGWRWPGRC